ncbi:hypothetical protein [Oceanibium sediminis]|uniref:hypothetical protein n=1 Tax=Oceanibium sediminis TaxID=2026339 RepID=UPI0018E55CFE|nr:hypothetical protein [Oceanibium sediminis]
MTCHDDILLKDWHVVADGARVSPGGHQQTLLLGESLSVAPDPRAETPIRADQVAILYRRWLRDHSVTYGAIAAG